MSKIRTLAQLQQEMSREFAWRKKELHGLKVLVVANKAGHSQDLYIRAAVPLLYAHWEGFVKRIGTYYLEFVARKEVKNEELPAHFLAMVVANLVHGAAESSKMQQSLDVVEFFRSKLPEKSSINWRAGIRTKANLKASVFHEIAIALGLDYSKFATKEKLLDERLLKNRNNIAHGQYSSVDYDTYIELHDEVLLIMQDFYNQIDQLAFSGAYRRTPA